MLYDPVDAFFQGLTSSFVRIPLTFLPLLIALACFTLPHGELAIWSVVAFPLVVLGVIIAWAAKGVVFFVGLFAFLIYLVASWRFIQTDYPKEIFALLFLAAFVLFIPLTWDSESVVWKTYALGGCFVALYALIGYALPILLERLHKKNNA